jgi:hypothetical protein
MGLPNCFGRFNMYIVLMMGFSFCSFKYWHRRKVPESKVKEFTIYKVSNAVFDFVLIAFPFWLVAIPLTHVGYIFLCDSIMQHVFECL